MPGIRPPMTKEQVIARLDDNTYKDPNSGCWIWLNSLTPTGYPPARYTAFKKYVTAYRLSYFLYRGEIPDGLEVDHICRMRCCINPWHLRLVTHAENTRRGIYPKSTHRNGRKTHCKRGHEFNENNTYIDNRGNRQCRICIREKNRLARRRSKCEFG